MLGGGMLVAFQSARAKLKDVSVHVIQSPLVRLKRTNRRSDHVSVRHVWFQMVATMPNIGVLSNQIRIIAKEVIGLGPRPASDFPLVQRRQSHFGPFAVSQRISKADICDRVIHFVGNTSSRFAVRKSPIRGFVMNPPKLFEPRFKDHCVV